MGVSFKCPHCPRRLAVWFSNPVDNGPPIDARHKCLWNRVGDNFDSLTVTPSINATSQDPITPGRTMQHWHGYILDGALLGIQ